MSEEEIIFNRRAFLYALLTASPSLLLAACASQVLDTPTAQSTIEPQPTTAPVEVQATTPPQPAQEAVQPTATQAAKVLPATPACGDDDDDVTIAQTEGPFYTPNTPERTSLLEAGVGGTHMLLTGYVLSTGCQPVAGALLDFWHADDAGEYDNVGFKLRGHQFADENGRFTLETIMPGLYPGRTRHFHVKVQAANNPVLTTQLYFPDEPDNARDGIFNAALLMDVQDVADGKEATFNFVLDVV